MGDLSEHFSRWEFACRCKCGFNTVDAELITILEEAHQHFGNKVIDVSSGARCIAHNASVGGKPHSEHLKGRAADITIRDVNPYDVQKYFDEKYPANYGIGTYSDFTHVDTRSGMGRWG